MLLSGRGEPEAELAEQAVRDSGADLTILRSTGSPELQRGLPARARARRRGRAARRGRAQPFVDAGDIADVAVAALTDDRHVGQLYELTGPRLLTFADAAAEISEAAGRPIRYVPVSIDEHAAAAAEQGVPAEVIELLTYLFTEVLDGRNAHLADGVQRALGRSRGTSATTRAMPPRPASGMSSGRSHRETADPVEHADARRLRRQYARQRSRSRAASLGRGAPAALTRAVLVGGRAAVRARHVRDDVRSTWSSAPDEVATFISATPKIVFSRIVQDAGWSNTRFVTGSPELEGAR